MSNYSRQKRTAKAKKVMSKQSSKGKKKAANIRAAEQAASRRRDMVNRSKAKNSPRRR